MHWSRSFFASATGRFERRRAEPSADGRLQFIRDTAVLFVLPMVPLVLMVFWLIRVRQVNRYAKAEGNP